MALEALDSRVHVIVTLRKRGHSDDEITSVTSLFDSVDVPSQTMLAKLVTVEDPSIVAALVQILPDVRAALVKPNGKTAAQIVEEAAKPFMKE